MNMVLSLDAIRYVRGEELLTTYRLRIAIVPMGSFDEDPGARPARHIFVESKAPWDEIEGELPRFPGPPPPA